jgi:hypothetical protein
MCDLAEKKDFKGAASKAHTEAARKFTPRTAKLC